MVLAAASQVVKTIKFGTGVLLLVQQRDAIQTWVLFETGCWRWRNPRRHRWDSPLKTRFAPDSPLEESGFEPSVPLA